MHSDDRGRRCQIRHLFETLGFINRLKVIPKIAVNLRWVGILPAPARKGLKNKNYPTTLELSTERLLDRRNSRTRFRRQGDPARRQRRIDMTFRELAERLIIGHPQA
jgi:hypothetical protein